jgi:hypothetical protein
MFLYLEDYYWLGIHPVDVCISIIYIVVSNITTSCIHKYHSANSFYGLLSEISIANTLGILGSVVTTKLTALTSAIYVFSIIIM